MHNISNLFYFGATLHMFRTVSPSIIRSLRLYIQHQVHCYQAATELVWHVPDAVCTALDSWWRTERPSDTRRVLFQNKINLRYCASGWFYYRNILQCTVLQMSNLRLTIYYSYIFRFYTTQRGCLTWKFHGCHTVIWKENRKQYTLWSIIIINYYIWKSKFNFYLLMIPYFGTFRFTFQFGIFNTSL